MAAPDLTQRQTCFVQKQGTDDAGWNAVGAPFSRLTIAAALADLQANYPVASATNPHIVAVGPGTFLEAGIVLPPFTFINGECDGEGQPTTIIQLSASITLSAAWAANTTQSGGLGNVTIRAASGTPAMDFTMPVPVGGNPSRIVMLENVRHSLTSQIFQATSTADVLRENGTTQDGVNTDTFTQTGGSSVIHNRASAAGMTVRDATGFPAAATWRVVSTGTGAGITVNSTTASGTTMRLTASNPRSLTISQTAPGAVLVSSDAASIPVTASLTFTGTATSAANLTRISDANGEGYSPTTPADWLVAPATVQQALDELAAAVGPGGIPNPLPVNRGGTGGQTQQAALAGLGAFFNKAVTLTANRVITAADRGTLFILASAGAITITMPDITDPAVRTGFCIGFAFSISGTESPSLATLTVAGQYGANNFVPQNGRFVLYISSVLADAVTFGWMNQQLFDATSGTLFSQASATISEDWNHRKLLGPDGVTVVGLWDTAGNGWEGTGTNNGAQAAAGVIGEYAETIVLVGAALNLAGNVLTTIATLALTAGNWDLYGQVRFTPTGGPVTTYLSALISTAAGTFQEEGATVLAGAIGLAVDTRLPTPMRQIFLAAPATMYLIGQTDFVGGSMKGSGKIWARRRF